MDFPTFFDDLPITRRALEFAAARHTGQRRAADQAPFILHPLEVAQLLRGRDYPDEVIAAGVLHDVIESAGVGHAELEERFGQHVAALVSAVTEPSTEGGYRERKAALRDAVASAEPDAVAIYAADKVAKLRELRIRIVTTQPRGRPGHARPLLGEPRAARAAPPGRRAGAAAALRARGSRAAAAQRRVLAQRPNTVDMSWTLRSRLDTGRSPKRCSIVAMIDVVSWDA